MVITKHFYEYGKNVLEDRVELLDNRNQYMNTQYIKMFKDELKNIQTQGNVGVFYAGGVGMHTSECRELNKKGRYTQPFLESGPVVKSLQAYMMHRYIGLMPFRDKVVYANINSNTCASSLHSVYEAQRLIESGLIDTAIIIAEEKTSTDTIRIFREHRIDVTPGEGFACIVISRFGEGPELVDSKWGYKYNVNPFLVDAEGYSSVNMSSDVVKGHQTGTEQNDNAETEVFGDREIVGYKSEIGHCQGASGLIELCIGLDDSRLFGDVLFTASGLGGFYGSCLIRK